MQYIPILYDRKLSHYASCYKNNNSHEIEIMYIDNCRVYYTIKTIEVININIKEILKEKDT